MKINEKVVIEIFQYSLDVFIGMVIYFDLY